MLKQLLPRMNAFLGAFWDLFFTPAVPRSRRWAAWVWIALVYLLGAYWFGLFFEWGDHSLFFMDWADITGPRLTFLRDAIQTGQLPLHLSDPSATHGATYRYLSVPDTEISPQAILLLRVSVTRFNFFDVLILYTAGYAGLLALRKRLRLSLIVFTAVSLLYNFNGNILAHYSVGHTSWSGYFFFSWFVWLALRLIDGDRSWRWTFYTTALLFAIWLQGSFHHFVWLLFFLAFGALFIRGAFWFCLRAGTFALLASAFRLFPAALLVGKYNAEFITGFPTLYSVWDALTNPANQLNAFYFPAGIEGAGGWEFNTYIGLAAALALLYFGVYRGLVRRDSPFRSLALPLAGMFFLCFGEFYGWLRLLPIPLIQGERLSSRSILVLLVFLIVIAAERLQRWLDAASLDAARTDPAPRIGTAIVVLITVSELWLNIQAWRIANAEKFSWWVYFDRHKWFVANQMDDTLYIGLVFGGLALTILTLAALAFAAWKENRPPRTLPAQK
jgi:hypothetical protein